MKQIFRYLYECRYISSFFLLCVCSFACVFALYGIPVGAVAYPLLLCFTFALLFLIAGFIKHERKHCQMLGINGQSGALFDVLDDVPPADSQTEKDYQKLLSNMEKAFREEREKAELSKRDMEDYYAVWVHQIKAPIAVMKVMLQQSDTEENRELAAELFRIEQYAEMALYYIRLGEGASDLLIQEYDLDEIIRKTIRKYAGQFIRKKLKLTYNGTEQKVLTDEKWLSFIIGQLLSNAVKYTFEGTVEISVNEQKVLTVSDTGIGISKEDLPRIFEKGYTGYNGRMGNKSTGIGLYLCRKAADKLGHRISVRSEPGKGSSFCVDLESYPFQAE